MRDYRKLQVWQKAHQLTLEVYKTTDSFPKSEQYGLVAQARRASASVAANIAEGYGHVGDGELARFLGIAMASSSELSYHLLLAKDLGYMPSDEYDGLYGMVDQVQRMLVAFRLRVETGQ